MKSTTQLNIAKLPGAVALWADKNNTPHEPWNKPAEAHPIIVKAGEKGYHPVTPRLDVDHWNATADEGKPATRQQIVAMMYGSVFGFHCPAADPDSYDDTGALKRVGGNDIVDPMVTNKGKTSQIAFHAGDVTLSNTIAASMTDDEVADELKGDK